MSRRLVPMVAAWLAAGAVTLMAAGTATPALVPVHMQRYCMGTMVDVMVYDESASHGAQAAARALDECERLDRVLSHFKDESDLSKLNREAGRGFVRVDPSLYDVLEQSIAWSRRTGGRFDVTIGPLMRTWKKAYDEGRPPSEADLATAVGCVGAEKIELAPPDRVRFRSACLELDLGGIGKGYAVDRALARLAADGVSRALINAGGSSIGAIGAPPDQDGWPVRLGAPVGGRDVLLLRDASMSTSQQHPRPFARATGTVADIVDPRTGAPIAGRAAVTVVIPNNSRAGVANDSNGSSSDSGTVAEVLTKALLMMPSADAAALLDPMPDVSALWMSPAGELTAGYRAARLSLAGAPRSR